MDLQCLVTGGKSFAFRRFRSILGQSIHRGRTHMTTVPENLCESQAAEPKGRSFQEDFEQAIRSYAKATEAGDTVEALQAALSAFKMAANEAARNPTPDLQLAQEAEGYEEAGDWSAAEAAYRQLIEISSQAGTPGLITKPQMELSQLLRLIGRLDEAWEFALAATASARASELSPLIAMALENEAMCALERGDSSRALEASSQAVAVLEPGRLTAHMRARALIHRAECLLACPDAESAENDLNASWKILGQEPLSSILPGPIATRTKWWEVRGKLDLEAGNLSQAAEALTKAIEYRRQRIEVQCHTSPYAAAALAKVLEALGDVAQQRGDPAAALDAALEAKVLREQAHLPAAGAGVSRR